MPPNTAVQKSKNVDLPAERATITWSLGPWEHFMCGPKGLWNYLAIIWTYLLWLVRFLGASPRQIVTLGSLCFTYKFTAVPPSLLVQGSAAVLRIELTLWILSCILNILKTNCFHLFSSNKNIVYYKSAQETKIDPSYFSLNGVSVTIRYYPLLSVCALDGNMFPWVCVAETIEFPLCLGTDNVNYLLFWRRIMWTIRYYPLLGRKHIFINFRYGSKCAK